MGLERISAMRKASGLTLDELSARSGVPVSTLKKISAGITKKPSIETIKSIVHAMGFTLDDLDSEAPDWLENKKSPPTSQEMSEEEAAVRLYQALVEAGFIQPGEELTSQQAAFLDGLSTMLSAFFDS